MTHYNPADWFWTVLDHSGSDVWSSKAAAYVPEDDPAYVAFLDAGNIATVIDSEDSLRVVLGRAYPPGMPLTDQQEADKAVAERLGLGIVVTSTGMPEASATYPLDDRGVALSGSTARDVSAGLGLPAAAATAPYADIEGTSHALTGEQFVALYTAQRDLRAVLSEQGVVMAGGGTPVWPDQTATIP